MHPGIVGDRGPSSIDWAILEGERQWGILNRSRCEYGRGRRMVDEQSGTSTGAKVIRLSQNPAADAGMKGVRDVLEKLKTFRLLAAKAGVMEELGSVRDDIVTAISYLPAEREAFLPRPWNRIPSSICGRLRPSMKQVDRRINWATDTTEAIVQSSLGGRLSWRPRSYLRRRVFHVRRSFRG